MLKNRTKIKAIKLVFLWVMECQGGIYGGGVEGRGHWDLLWAGGSRLLKKGHDGRNVCSGPYTFFKLRWIKPSDLMFNCLPYNV